MIPRIYLTIRSIKKGLTVEFVHFVTLMWHFVSLHVVAPSCRHGFQSPLILPVAHI